ncbi:MAG: hypothetical protein HFH41_05855 [Lachnospiraceae bacterium]|nr:hypothetical protein [Lachnospiraceae bacterium]
MYQPLELIENYCRLAPGEAKLSGIRQAIQEADLAKDYKYMMYFRYAYADSCSENYLLYLYLIFPEILQLFEEYPDLEMPGWCCLDTVDAVMDIFSRVIDCADFFYQISISDMEQYLEKYKTFCLKYGYALFEYHMASARLYRATGEKTKAMQSLHDFQSLCRSTHRRNPSSIGFEGEMASWYGDLDTLLKTAKLLEKKYHDDEELIYEYGRLLYHYAVRIQDFKSAEPYYKKMEYLRRKHGLHSYYFADTMVYLTATNPNAAWSFFKKEAPYQALTYTPLDKMEFSTGAEIMMRNLLKQGKTNMRLSLPSRLPYYQENGCYHIKALAEYFGREAREIASKFDIRNGNDNSIQEYELFLAAAQNYITP